VMTHIRACSYGRQTSAPASLQQSCLASWPARMPQCCRVRLGPSSRNGRKLPR
jgi:hypothetical protein